MEPWFVNIIELLLRNRRFWVHVDQFLAHPEQQISTRCSFGTNLVQFIHTHLPITSCYKFIYADNISCTVQVHC